MIKQSAERKDGLIVAGKELLKGFQNAGKALKEVINPPKEYFRSFVARAKLQEQIPDIDWFSDAKWEDVDPCYNTDSSTPALWESAYMDNTKEKLVRNNDETLDDKTKVSVYTRTYTTFSGQDCVATFNGIIMGELQGYRINLNGQSIGTIDLSYIRFEMDHITPENTLVVVTYLNEYGQGAYEIFVLGKLLNFKTEMNIDKVTTTVYERYAAKMVSYLNPIPVELKSMSDEDFMAMVKRAREKCPETQWVKDEEHPKNHMCNRMYYWVLEHIRYNTENA